jgi:hypothetical protein
MSHPVQFNAISLNSGVDAEKGIIFGVCVMSKGEAKGHGLLLDDESLRSFIKLTENRPNGVGTRFGADHDAGAEDFNGTLKNFRLEDGKIRADLHLLKSDKNYSKLIEMAQTMPHEFGLSASTNADEVKIDGNRCVRFTEVLCVDVVSNPAATKGLFFSTKSNNMKTIALALGLPETATEAEIEQAAKLAFESKCKMSEEDKEKKKKEMEADDEEKGKQGKKFEELVDRLTKLEAAEKTRQEQVELAAKTAHKAEVENLKLEAAKEGKVITLTDEALLKLSIAEVKEHIAKLEKGKVNLGKEKTPTNKSFDAEGAKHLRNNGALQLGQMMVNQLKLKQ